MNICLRISVLLFSLLLCACASKRPVYQITVGNGHQQEAIRNVTLKVDGEEVSTFERIGAIKAAGTKPGRGELPDQIELSWTDSRGDTHTNAVDVNIPTIEQFSGNLLCEISTDNQLQLHAIPAVEDNWSVIPWAAPESWEGSIGVPGMEAQ